MSCGVLFVEDEAMLRLYWEDICEMADIPVCGMVATVAEAMTLLDEKEFTAVVLDVNLAGETSEVIAERLQTTDVPVLVSTGSYPGSLPHAYRGYNVISKPFRPQEMEDALRDLLDNC